MNYKRTKFERAIESLNAFLKGRTDSLNASLSRRHIVVQLFAGYVLFNAYGFVAILTVMIVAYLFGAPIRW